MTKFTKQQAIVISGYTGFLCCSFSAFHEDVERRFGHPVFTHQFGDKAFADKVCEMYKKDFVAMCPQALDTPL